MTVFFFLFCKLQIASGMLLEKLPNQIGFFLFIYATIKQRKQYKARVPRGDNLIQ